MAAAADTYFGNRAKAAVGVAGFTPVLADLFTVGRGWEANITWETAELYGTDSIFRVDEAKYQVKVEAKLKGCKFGGTTGIWQQILNALNGAAAGTGTIADTNAIYLHDVYIYAVGSTTPASDLISIKCTNCYLEGCPIPLPENDFITLDLTFKGRGALIGNSAAPTS
jgi:hypothetical protein